MSLRRGETAGALGGLLLVLVAGCGGSDRLSKDEYLRRVRAIEASQGPTVRLFEKLVVGAISQQECARTAHEFADALDGMLDRVEALKPPNEVEDLQDEFVDAARESVDRVGKLADDVEDGEVACGQDYNRRAYGLASTRRAERILQQFADKGYLIGLNSGD